MKIASWNVNSLNVRLPHVLDWLGTSPVDVLALQETKLTDERFPTGALADLGYQSAFTGQPTYNGVALLSRQPAEDVVTDPAGVDCAQRRVIAGTIDGVRVINLYVVNGKSVGDPKYHFKLEWLAAVRAWIAEEMKRHREVVVVGDFNVAPEDVDVHDPARWQGKILCSEPERQALDDIMALGLSDTLRLHHEEGGIFSWWDYRAAAFRRNMGLRIDLILSSDALSERCSAGYVDVEPRRWERPSDHTPVVAEFER